MKFPLFNFLKAKENALDALNSPTLKKIKSLQEQNNISLFFHKEIFHHTLSYPITLILYDKLRGLYIFEIKEWSFDDLKDATATKTENSQSAEDSLSFSKTHKIIKQKFNELEHNDGVAIFNYLIMDNLSSLEYENLDDSLKALLPKEKILFSDSREEEIIQKLQNAAQESFDLPSPQQVFGTLFIQYTIVENKECLHLCNEDQINFIDAKISGVTNLKAPLKSGKSYAILLKSIKELFKQERQKIIIIKPNMIAKEILYKRFLELLEHAIIEIDLMAFEILTPTEYLNRHLEKLKMPLLKEDLIIEEKLLKKQFHPADLIICDDADLMPKSFINYLKKSASKADLLFVNEKNLEETFQLSKSYQSTDTKAVFHQTNPYAKALHLIFSLLKEHDPKEIVVISNHQTRQNLQEDLSTYIKEEATLLDASQHLIEQKLETLLLLSYDDIFEMRVKHTLLIDICSQELAILHYAFGITQERVHLLYEEECDHIKQLKEEYESN